jgi:polyisoprenoid-binding protein YceI
VTLRADLVVDRSAFGMTWSPLGMAAKEAASSVAARFVRS